MPAERTHHRAHKIARLAMLAAVAMVLHLCENLLPPPVAALPMIRLGLANIVTVYLLQSEGPQSAFAVMAVRCIVAPLLGGAPTQVLYSLAGGVLSLCVMALLQRMPRIFSVYGVSMAGAFAHNVGQLLMASFLLSQSAVWAFLPYMTLAAAPTGLLVGACARLLGKSAALAGRKA